METLVGWLLSTAGLALKLVDLIRNRRKPMLQVTGKAYRSRAGSFEIDVVLDAGEDTLIESISFDDCLSRSETAFPLVVHKTGSVIRVTNLGYKKLQITAKPTTVTFVVVPKDGFSGSIHTGRAKSSQGEAVFYVDVR